MNPEAQLNDRCVSLRRYPEDGGVQLLHSAGAAVDVVRDAEHEARLFSVVLPEGGAVRPVDWRRFAYDHDKVTRLIAQCVHDNLSDAVFHPINDELTQAIERRLTLALRDLATVFDVTSVRCESRDDALDVGVEGEFKNGRRSTVAVVRPLSD